MKLSKTSIFTGLLLSVLTIAGCNSTCKQKTCGWKPLFEGTIEDGKFFMHNAGKNKYDEKYAFEDMFEVTGDEIRVLYNWQAENAPYIALTTKEEYSNYDVKLQYKWGTRKFKPRLDAKRDAGLLLHIHELTDNSWPRCIECQIQEGDTGDMWLIGSEAIPLTEAGEGIKFEKPDAFFKNGRRYHLNENDGWNDVLVKVRGDSAKYYVNGMLVNQFKSARKKDDNSPLTSGHIGIQSEAAEVTYRNIMIKEIGSCKK